MKNFIYERNSGGLTENEIHRALSDSLDERERNIGRKLENVLIIPPDFTRLHSGAGLITNICYHRLTSGGCNVDILPALGTHVSMTREETGIMYGDIPYEKFLCHNWRKGVVKIGEVPSEYIGEITEGLWRKAVNVEVNRLIMDEKYDLILSVGQVVPHEVIGMSNHSKNLLVGTGGSDMINSSHMIGAVFGMERMMGRDHTPVRKLLDYSMEHYLGDRPIMFALTVCTAEKGNTIVHGLFIGDTREPLEAAIELSQKKNIEFLNGGIEKCVVYLDPSEFKSMWLGNKAVYRTRMAIADGGELLIMAPGIERFGEDEQVDRLIRKYGYRGRDSIMEQFKKPENQELRDNMSAAAHLIHGSPDGRFTVTYAVKNISGEEIESAGFEFADYDDIRRKYNPEKLRYGYNTMEGGEKIYYIPNPSLGLWINREKFCRQTPEGDYAKGRVQ